MSSRQFLSTLTLPGDTAGAFSELVDHERPAAQGKERANKKGGYCTFCRRQGHTLEECRSKNRRKGESTKKKETNIKNPFILNRLERKNLDLLCKVNEWRSYDRIVAFPYCETDLNDFPVLQAEVKKILEDGFNLDKFPSSIHTPEAIRFFKKLGGGKDLLSLLKFGYTPLYNKDSLPNEKVEIIHLENNKSAVKHMDFCVRKVDEWVKKGFVVPRKGPGIYLNPLTVNEKELPDGSMKMRLCLDLSRTLNPRLLEVNSQLDMLKDVRLRIETNDFFTVSDIESMYCNVKLNPKVYDLFCFCIIINNEKRYFNYITIPFGLAPAGGIMSQITKPIKAFLISLNIRFFIYVDDSITIANNTKRCSVHYHFTILIFQLCGWPLNIEKSIMKPVQNITYLGFILDSKSMLITASETKIQRLVNMIKNVLKAQTHGQSIPSRDMAKILGKTASLIPSHGRGVRILTRTAQHELGCVVTHKGWSSHLAISQKVALEFEKLIQYLRSGNGCIIPKKDLTFNILGESFALSEFEDLSKETTVCVSDSSDKFSFVYTTDGKFVTSNEFAAHEQIESSGYRELLSVRDAILKKPDFLQQNARSTIVWITDSTSLVSYLNKGSRLPNIQDILFQIYVKLLQFNIVLVPKWVSRNSKAIQWADEGSKLFLKRSDEFGVCNDDFVEIQEKFGVQISVDCMATRISRRVDRFWAPCPQMGAEKIDFFGQEFAENEIFYVAPPPKMATRCLIKILQSKGATFIFSFPYFQTSQLASLYCDEDGWCKPFVRNLHFKQGDYISFYENSLFSGKTKFCHMFLLICTSTECINRVCKNPFSKSVN